MRYFTVAFFNIRSLIAHFNEFRSFIVEKRYDVVAVCETWLNSNISSDTVAILF